MDGYIEQLDHLDSRQFAIAARRLADSLSYGTDHSPFLGSGVEYVQSRMYQPGDPVKALDWKVIARTGKYFVKEYESPKRLPCYLLLDSSASMVISSVKRSKYETALHIAGGIAFACLDRVSPVGVLGVGESDMHVRPSLSGDQIMQWMMKLRRFRYDEKTTLSRRLAELNPILKNTALIIVFSDLHDENALPALKCMNQNHDCVVLQFRDPAEQQLRGAGFVRAREAESGETFVTHGRKHWLDQDRIDQELKRAGIDHLLIETDQPFAHQLRNFFESRGVLTRGAR